jgi:hypothetical protein
MKLCSCRLEGLGRQKNKNKKIIPVRMEIIVTVEKAVNERAEIIIIMHEHVENSFLLRVAQTKTRSVLNKSH